MTNSGCLRPVREGMIQGAAAPRSPPEEPTTSRTVFACVGARLLLTALGGGPPAPPKGAPIMPVRLGATQFRTGQEVGAVRYTHQGKYLLAGALFSGHDGTFTLLDAA